MGGALATAHGEARQVFDEINEALGEDLFAVMRDGPDDAIRLTRNAQPALFATSMAALAVLCAKTGRTVAKLADFTAGHSLGEYAALAAAGSISIADGARLLRLRGDAMQSAVAVGEGAMAAILGADEAMIDEIVAAAGEAGVVQLANDNAPGQIVISGSLEAVDRAMEIARDKGLRKVIKLPVSAPFIVISWHLQRTRWLQPLQISPLLMPRCRFSVMSRQHGEQVADALKSNLITQVTGRVRWRESLIALDAAGASDFVEIGTGKVLSGLVKRTLNDKTIVNFESPDDLDAVLALF